MVGQLFINIGHGRLLTEKRFKLSEDYVNTPFTLVQSLISSEVPMTWHSERRPKDIQDYYEFVVVAADVGVYGDGGSPLEIYKTGNDHRSLFKCVHVFYYRGGGCGLTPTEFSKGHLLALSCYASRHDCSMFSQKKKKNSVVLVRKRTIPIERSPPVSEASANFSR
jgi:hypothetical protein